MKRKNPFPSSLVNARSTLPCVRVYVGQDGGRDPITSRILITRSPGPEADALPETSQPLRLSSRVTRFKLGLGLFFSQVIWKMKVKSGQISM